MELISEKPILSVMELIWISEDKYVKIHLYYCNYNIYVYLHIERFFPILKPINSLRACWGLLRNKEQRSKNKEQRTKIKD